MSSQTQTQIQVSESQVQSPCDYIAIKAVLINSHGSLIVNVIRCAGELHVPDLRPEVREKVFAKGQRGENFSSRRGRLQKCNCN